MIWRIIRVKNFLSQMQRKIQIKEQTLLTSNQSKFNQASPVLILSLFVLALFSLAAYSANPFLKTQEMQIIKGSVDTENSKAIMIVLDSSGSMAEPAPGSNTKMLAAKQVLEQVLSKIDTSIPVGLRVYGSSKNPMSEMEACSDSVLLVPPGTGNRAQMVNKLRELKPNGATPISYAIQQAVNDLKFVNVKYKNIVLISDGMETCGRDPCALAEALKANNIDMQFNVVGFGVGNDWQAKAQLKCVAAATSGKYYDADSAGQLSNSILDGINSTANVSSSTGKIKEVEK